MIPGDAVQRMKRDFFIFIGQLLYGNVGVNYVGILYNAGIDHITALDVNNVEGCHGQVYIAISF